MNLLNNPLFNTLDRELEAQVGFAQGKLNDRELRDTHDIGYNRGVIDLAKRLQDVLAKECFDPEETDEEAVEEHIRVV